MSKKYFLLFIIIFLFSFSLAYADVVINEFVSRPNAEEHEWIELLNTTGSPIDLTGWKLTELSSPGTNPTENDLLSLSGTLDDVLIFEINSSKLNDTGDSIGLYNGATFIDRVTYGTDSTIKNYSIDITAPTIGTSGALISDVWETNQVPTKGAENPNQASSSDDSDNEEEDDEEDSTTSSSSSSKSSSNKKAVEPKPKATTVPKIKAQITAKALGYVGIPFTMSGTAFGLKGEQLFKGKYFWNFGDGDFRETKVTNTEKFTHTYFYGGDYTVQLEYYSSFLSDVPDASEKVTIKVVVPEVLISSVGDGRDFFVELSNNTSYEVDLSNWLLKSDQRSFTIPRNTMIGPKKKVIISSRISNLSVEDKTTLQLINPEGELMFDYFAPVAQVVPATIPMKTVARTTVQSNQAQEVVSEEINTENTDEANVFENLPAAVAMSDTTPEENNSYIPTVVSFALIGAAAGAVYFIRQKKSISQAGDDFKILDE